VRHDAAGERIASKGGSIRFPILEPNRRPKTGCEVVAAQGQVSGFTANPSPSSGAGKWLCEMTSPRLRLAGQYKVEKMPNFEEELFRRGEVCPPKSLDRHSFSGGG